MSSIYIVKGFARGLPDHSVNLTLGEKRASQAATDGIDI